MQYFYLFMAVIFEVSGTMLLPVSQNFTRIIPTLLMGASYLTSFFFLTLALNTLPLAVVYASWSGLGIFLIAIFAYFVFQQPLEWRAILGLIIIVIGVFLVNFYGPHK